MFVADEAAQSASVKYESGELTKAQYTYVWKKEKILYESLLRFRLPFCFLMLTALKFSRIHSFMSNYSKNLVQK